MIPTYSQPALSFPELSWPLWGEGSLYAVFFPVVVMADSIEFEPITMDDSITFNVLDLDEDIIFEIVEI